MKRILHMFMVVLVLAAVILLPPIDALAAEGGVSASPAPADYITVEAGAVTLHSDSMAKEGISSLQMTLTGADGFTFSEALADRMTYVSHTADGVTIYIAGKTPLMAESSTALVLGTVTSSGGAVKLAANSLKYVYGSRTVIRNVVDEVEESEPQPQAGDTPVATPEPTQAPTATPVPTPTATPVPTPTATPVPTPTATPMPTPTATPVPTPTATPVPTQAPTATPMPTPEPTQVPTATPVPTPTATPEPTQAPTATPVPTPEPTQAPTVTPMPTPVATPENQPPAGGQPDSGFTDNNAGGVIGDGYDDGTGSGDPEPTATPEPTNEPTATAAPTETPVPTSEPTMTTEPTKAPVATSEPLAGAVNTAAPTAAGQPVATGPQAPETGDETVFVPWALTLILCGALLAVVLIRGKRRQ